MQFKCPCCNASFSLEAALAVDAGRSALLVALQMPAPLGLLLAQYLGLFRAAGRALAFDRVERLLAELQPMLDKAVITRNGATRPCPISIWQQGIERVIEARNADKLQLPLKTHGYLLEIVYALAEQAGAQQEKAQEAQRKAGVRPTAEGNERVQRSFIINSLKGEIHLGLITIEYAREQLRRQGINPEVLDG